jgi:hypothetical protein
MAQDYALLYANDTQIQVSPWDIRIQFGEIVDPPPTAENPVLHIRAAGEVRMSPQHAKKVAAILDQQIQLYESRIGPIPMPQDP